MNLAVFDKDGTLTIPASGGHCVMYGDRPEDSGAAIGAGFEFVQV